MLRPIFVDSIDSRALTPELALVPALGAELSEGLGASSTPVVAPASSLFPSQPVWREARLEDWTEDNLFLPAQIASITSTPVVDASSSVARPMDLGAIGVNVSLLVNLPASPAPSLTLVDLPPLAPATEVSEPVNNAAGAGANDSVLDNTVDSALDRTHTSDLTFVAIPVTPPVLQVPQPFASYSGELSESDDFNPQRSATFKDDYILNVGEHSTIQFGLTSNTFDSYLQLLRLGSDEIFAFDDDSGQGRDSQLSLKVDQGDRFIVRVTSYDREAIGPYRLNLTAIGADSDLSVETSADSSSGLETGAIDTSRDETSAGETSDGETSDGEISDGVNIADDGNIDTDPSTPLRDSNLLPNPEQFNPRSGYGLVNAAAAVAAALHLAQSERIEPEHINPFAEAPDLGGFDQPLDLLQVPEAWAQGFTGSGVTIAVIDSGVDSSHPELQNSLWINRGEIAGDGIDNDQNGYIDDVNGWNFGRNQLNNAIAPGTHSLFQGHGTHVAGIIAGANDGNGNTGVAYDANIMSLRLGDTNNAGLFSNPGNLATAVRYAVDNGANVINLSLNWSDSPALRTALEYAAENNVVVVGASGNRGLSNPASPARYAVNWGLSVGAVNANGELITFSNGAGDNAEIRHVLAPGNSIVSASPGGGYATRTGTSMSAPYVAGVAALMLSANPSLTTVQIRDILAATATAIL